MADAAPAIHIGENSPEQVALKLYYEVGRAEKDAVHDRQWILDTYAECLLAVRRPADRLPKKPKEPR